MKAKNYLIINPFGIGDVIFSSPMIRAIKDSEPESKVFYLCNRRTESFLKHHPDIEELVVYERDEWVALRKESFIKWIKVFVRFIKDIKNLDIDIALDLSMNTYFSLYVFCAGVKKRIGLNYKSRGRFLNKKINILGFENKHVIEYYSDVLRAADIEVNVKGMEVYYPDKSAVWANEFLVQRQIDSENLIVVAPVGGQAFGKQAGAKQWPKENFAALLQYLTNELGKKVLCLGSKAEENTIKCILEMSGLEDNVYVICDRAIVDIMAIIDRSQLFISNDTGLLRAADALKKNCIAIFGPVDDRVYGLYPYDNKRHRLLCGKPICWPCYKRFRLAECESAYKCLTDVKVDDVIAAVNDLIV